MTSVVSLAVALVFAVESGGRARVRPGDGGRAVGPAQIWPVMVREVNRIAETTFSLADRADPVKARRMVRLYLSWRHFRDPSLDAVRLAALWRNPNGKCPEWHLRKLRRAMRGNAAGEVRRNAVTSTGVLGISGVE